MLRKLFLIALLSAILPLNALAFQNANTPQLYFFTSANCGPCKQVEPEIQLLISKGYPVSVVDINRQPAIAQQFQVDRTPTTMLILGNQVVGRRPGLISAHEIVGWFDSARTLQKQNKPQPTDTRERQLRQDRSGRSAGSNFPRGTFAKGLAAKKRFNSGSLSDTIHKGTRTPNSEVEFTAMRASVRLKVEDPEGISFATGTIIHSQKGECLVLTCGHVFRDAGGKGVITADIGFETDQIKTVPGRLVSYDAGARDIGLVIIETGFHIPPAPLAPPTFAIQKGDQVYTLGCDHGQDATIRRTRIKNQALYNNAKKYDIYGRPVDGRSGGGLFTAGGQLIGVCNAMAVEVDEGVYTSLENIYWQLAQVNLTHLFQPNQAIAQDRSFDRVPPQRIDERRQLADAPRRAQPLNRDFGVTPRRTNVENLIPAQPDGRGRGVSGIVDAQVIVLVQSKSSPGKTETMVIENPTEDLMNQLRSQKSNPNQSQASEFARLREQMPRVSPTSPRNAELYRAQSPR